MCVRACVVACGWVRVREFVNIDVTSFVCKSGEKGCQEMQSATCLYCIYE